MNYRPPADDYRIRYMQYLTQGHDSTRPRRFNCVFDLRKIAPIIADSFELKSAAVAVYKGKVRYYVLSGG